MPLVHRHRVLEGASRMPLHVVHGRCSTLAKVQGVLSIFCALNSFIFRFAANVANNSCALKSSTLEHLVTVSARCVLTFAAYLVAMSVWLCIDRVEGEVVLACFALLVFSCRCNWQRHIAECRVHTEQTLRG